MGDGKKIPLSTAFYALLLGDLQTLSATQKENNHLKYALKRLAVSQRLVRPSKRPVAPYAFHVTRTRSGAYKWTFRFSDCQGRPVYFHGVAKSFSDSLAALFYSLENETPHPDKLKRS